MAGEITGWWTTITSALQKEGVSIFDAGGYLGVTKASINTALPAGLDKLLTEYKTERTNLSQTGSLDTHSSIRAAWTDEDLQERIEVIERFQLYLKAGWPQLATTEAIKFWQNGAYIPGPSDDGGNETGGDRYKELPAYAGSSDSKISIGTSEYERTAFDQSEWPPNYLPPEISDPTRFWDEMQRNGTRILDYWQMIYLAWNFGIVAQLMVGPTTFGPGGGIPGLPSVEQATALVQLVVYEMYLRRAELANGTGTLTETLEDLVEVKNNQGNRSRLEFLLEKKKAYEADNTKPALTADEYNELLGLLEALEEGEIGSATPEDADQIAERIRFSEQTILMRNLKSFAVNYSALVKQRARKYNKTYLMYGNPSEMVNRLTLKPGMSEFLNFRTHEISQLAPKFKLYQVVYNDKNEFVREVEYKFANRNNIGSEKVPNILESRGREAVGVKSFQWKYIGTDPVTARNDLTAELQIFFQSFDDLFEKRMSVDHEGVIYTYRYVDLILRNPEVDGETVLKSPDENNEGVLNPADDRQKPEKFETKVIVGWNFKGTELEKRVTEDNPNITDLSYFNEVLFMTLIDHEFGIEEDGTFSLTITYRARLDAMMQDKRSDVLATTNIITNRAKFEKEIKELEKKCEQSEEAKENLKKLKDEYEERKMIFRKDSYQSILNELTGIEPPPSGEDTTKQPRVYLISIDMAEFVAAGKDISKVEDYLVAPESELALTTEKIQSSFAEKVINTGPEKVSFFQSATNAKDAVSETIQSAASSTGFDDLSSGAKAATVLGTAGAAIVTAPVSIPVGTTLAAGGAGALTADAGKSLWNDYQTNSIISSWETTGELNEEDINKFLMTTVPDIENGVYNIHYFFFGDLIELLAQRVLNAGRQKAITDTDASFSSEQLDNIRILLGSMEWFPMNKSSVEKPEAWRCVLGALPISLMVYKNFMLRRVIAKKRDIYSLLDFMRDFLKYLLDDVLGANSKESDDSLKLNMEVKSTVLTMPGKIGGSGESADPVLEKILENRKRQIEKNPDAVSATAAGGGAEAITLDLDTISETNTVVPYGDPESNSARRAYHYITIYVENKTPSHLRGFEEKDRQAGIYHFHIGENRSIFKRASFKRTNATYLREARFSEEHYNPLSTLASVYDVDVEMFGNTIFYPGQLMFINPFGLGKSMGFPWDPTSYSNIMGLGGYHLVTGVESTMDEDGFSTNVTARWETSGDGKKKDSRTDVNQPNCETPEATEIK